LVGEQGKKIDCLKDSFDKLDKAIYKIQYDCEIFNGMVKNHEKRLKTLERSGILFAKSVLSDWKTILILTAFFSMQCFILIKQII